MNRDDRKEPLRINVDEDIFNSDWLRVTWELPKYRSPEFFDFLTFSGLSLDQFRALPVYYHAVRNGLIDKTTDEWRGEESRIDSTESAG